MIKKLKKKKKNGENNKNLQNKKIFFLSYTYKMLKTNSETCTKNFVYIITAR